jgi:hypothetical protein
MIDQKTDARFMANVFPEPNSGCWLWDGATRGDGYGVFFDRKRVGAHVYAYVRENGPVPKGHLVHHRCNVRCCVNPQHLEATTYSKNAIDGWRRRKSISLVMPIAVSCREACTQANHVIGKFGGMHALARALSVGVSTVQTWKKSGEIKEWHWRAILRAANENGIEFIPEDFVAHLRATTAA